MIRIAEKIELTGTFKIQKAKVRKSGWDMTSLDMSKNRLFILQKGKYMELDDELFCAMKNESLRF